MSDILKNIQELQQRLNAMVNLGRDSSEVYELSTELDNWITLYYKNK